MIVLLKYRLVNNPSRRFHAKAVSRIKNAKKVLLQPLRPWPYFASLRETSFHIQRRKEMIASLCAFDKKQYC